MNRQWKCVSLLVLMSAGVAVAQEPQPTVAPFPLELRRMPSGFGNKDREELQAEFRRLVRSAGAMVPNAGSMDSALLALKRQDCDRENECLQQLAQKAQTLYALFASVDYDLSKNVVATGRVVRDDGKLIGELRTITIPRSSDPFKAVARVALVQLLEALKVKDLPPFREVATAVVVEPIKPVEPVKPNVLPPPPPPQVEKRTNLGRIIGWVGVGVGAAVGIAGVVAFATAPVVNKDLDGNIFAADKLKLAPAQAQQGLGVGLMAGGFGVAAAGAVMVAISKDSETVKTTLVPLPGGGVVLVGGSF